MGTSQEEYLLVKDVNLQKFLTIFVCQVVAYSLSSELWKKVFS